MATLRSKYMDAEQIVPFAGKTRHYAIKSKTENEVLGWVKWWAGQYCFFPETDTLYNVGCLASLVAFLSDLNREQREGRNEDD